MPPARPARASLSKTQARRVALAAQGFADPTPVRPDRRALRRVLDRVGIIQIDSVNVLCRSHYLPLYSRVGPYPREMLDRAASRAPRLMFEYWAHAASLVPLRYQPLLRWRMDRAHLDPWQSIRRIAVENPSLVTDVERLVMEYAEAMSSRPVTVTDEMVARLRRELDEAQLVELTMMIAVENSRSRFNSALGLTSQGFADRCQIPTPTR